MKDYVLFIHGVNTRPDCKKPEYADNLFSLISNRLTSRNLASVPLCWGDVNVPNENELRRKWQNSPAWPQLWFQDFREKQLLQFIGDAALYISRTVGSKAVIQMYGQLSTWLAKFDSDNDKLHIIAHSWGTVILFDILFASRWNAPGQPGADEVQNIRKFIQGVPDKAGSPVGQNQGLKIASIHTMGSPLAIYQLMADPASSHDIGLGLDQTLTYYADGKSVCWRNYLHP